MIPSRLASLPCAPCNIATTITVRPLTFAMPASLVAMLVSLPPASVPGTCASATPGAKPARKRDGAVLTPPSKLSSALVDAAVSSRACAMSPAIRRARSAWRTPHRWGPGRSLGSRSHELRVRRLAPTERIEQRIRRTVVIVVQHPREQPANIACVLHVSGIDRTVDEQRDREMLHACHRQVRVATARSRRAGRHVDNVRQAFLPALSRAAASTRPLSSTARSEIGAGVGVNSAGGGVGTGGIAASNSAIMR